MKYPAFALLTATLTLCAPLLSAHETRRRGMGDVVGSQAGQIRESVNDLMEKLALSGGSNPLGKEDIEGLLQLAQLEGQLEALAVLSRTGRPQDYHAIMEAVALTATAVSKFLLSLPQAGIVRGDWLRIQMDLRDLEARARTAGMGR